MMWIGLLVGAVVGFIAWQLPGAIVLGFLGWLVGLIVKSMRRPPSLEDRVALLEKTVAELQARLNVVPDAAPAEAIGDPGAGEPAPNVVPEPTPEPEPPLTPTLSPRGEGDSRPNPLIAWLTGGNTIARVGLLILFIGFAFLAKYAAEHQMLPVELRVAGVALGGIALLLFGWRLRHKSPAYALGLQGGGVAVLYLTTFAAMRLWNLLPPEAAFVLLALIAIFSAVLAIAQDSMSLAIIGAAGGFLAPVLASTGGGSHVMLFSYYLLLDIGIAAVAIFKAWRPLNLTGFAFTVAIGMLWGFSYYRPEYRETVALFVVAFWLLFIIVAILFARKQAPELRKFVDGTLVFGAPLAAFGMLAGTMRGVEMGLAYSSLAAAAVYLGIAAILYRARRESFALLSQAFVALGIVFVTLAIPLALDARWTSAVWALEGAAIVWVGLRQEQRIARLFGLGLQVLAGLAYIDSYRHVTDALPLLDSAFIGALLLAGAGLWTHRQLIGARERIAPVERKLVAFFFVWGLLWWLFGARHEIEVLLPWAYQLSAKVAMLGATALVLGWLALRWDWPHAAIATRWLLPALTLAALALLPSRGWVGNTHVFAGGGWLAWPFAIAVYFWTLRRMPPIEREGLRDTLHAGGVWLMTLVVALELHWLAAHYTARGTAWSVAAFGIPPALAIAFLASRRARERWPVADNPRAYLEIAPLVLALVLGFWSLYANVTHDGRSDPLPYMPILNALDLTHVLAGIALAMLGVKRGEAAVAAGAVAFIWLNGVLLRSLHHWADIPYTLHAMQRSVLAQASLSVFWSLLALALMIHATRSARRALWLTGAALMGVVVVKLFLVDFAHVGGIERIVSFIAVGVLMLVIGYFSPVPPRKA